jgi:hypothetical protein
MCQQAQDILSKLVQDYPLASEYQSLLGATQMNLGQVYLVKGWHEKAETALKEARGIFGRLVEGRPDALPEDRESLGKSHVLLGMAYRGANETEKGEKEQQQAEVEALLRQPNLSSLNVYNAACVFSRASAADHDTKLSPTDHNRVKARYAERAMDLLRQAVAKGWRHPSVIKKDPDLEPLRGRKDFQKLLAELEKQTKE